MDRKANYMSLKAKGVPVQEIEQLINFGAAPGCSLAVALPNSGIESISFGHLGEAGSPEVNTHTVYDLASITKLYTTALILRLHKAAKLSIYDKCSHYLDNFIGSEITLLDLLTHRVNFDIRLSDYRSKYSDGQSLNSALMGIKPPATPNTNIHYGNLEFIYLGKIVERVENVSLNNAMNKLFSDLGLNDTHTGADIGKLGVVTPPTEVLDGNIIQNMTHDETARSLGGIAGNAGVFATAEDLARFGSAWVEGRVVTTRELRQVVFSNHDQSGLKAQAIGWWMRISTPEGEISTPELYIHTGFTGSLLAINLQNSKVCAFTCNRTYYGRDNSKQKEIWRLLTNWTQK